MPTPLIAVMGPTASGKTALSLALAEHLAVRGTTVEIVSVDSVQVYRGLDIGAAKPDADERARVVHHLLDVCDPAERYSAARFAADARACIAQIHARGHLPLLVGGTMLYFHALLRGLSDLPPADAVLREQLTRDAQAQGWPALHARLAQLDSVTAARLHPNDGQRIQRALEVVLATGQPLSRLQGETRAQQDFTVLKLATHPASRESLHARIAQRLEQMMARGFVDEVRTLRQRPDLHAGLPSIRAVGYGQVWAALEAGSLDGAAQRALEATRQFAKRQVTWLRSEHDLCWLNSDDPGVVDAARREVDEWILKLPC